MEQRQRRQFRYAEVTFDVFRYAKQLTPVQPKPDISDLTYVSSKVEYQKIGGRKGDTDVKLDYIPVWKAREIRLNDREILLDRVMKGEKVKPDEQSRRRIPLDDIVSVMNDRTREENVLILRLKSTKSLLRFRCPDVALRKTWSYYILTHCLWDV